MNVISTLTLLALSSTLAHAQSAPEISKWTAGIPAIHSNVKDQGDVGFCWSFAWTSYLESKLKIEQNKDITISPMFIGRAYMSINYVKTFDEMADGLITPVKRSEGGVPVLARYNSLNPMEASVTRNLYTRAFQKHSENMEGFNFHDVYRFGAVPASVYEIPKYEIAPLGPVAGSIPPYVNRYQSPEFEYQFKDFVKTHLVDKATQQKYLGDYGFLELQTDFDRFAGYNPISMVDDFTFEGKTYNAFSFLREFVKFDPAQFPKPPMPRMEFTGFHEDGRPKFGFEDTGPLGKYGEVSEKRFDEAIAIIQKELDQRKPVLLGLVLLDDVDNNDNRVATGVMDPFYCAKPGDCEEAGGHAMMIVNSMKDENGLVKAFIVQNSWGPEGVTDTGERTLVRAKRGFDIITVDYLKQGLKYRPWAFKYMTL